jgi:hypothetical protein
MHFHYIQPITEHVFGLTQAWWVAFGTIATFTAVAVALYAALSAIRQSNNFK